MRISECLREDCVIVDLRADSKEDVLRALAAVGARAGQGLDEESLYRVIKEREGLGSTGIGSGVAIPHGKLPGLKDLVVVVARSVEGVPFDSVDASAVNLIFLLLAPDNAATFYLKLLARVSRLLKLEGAREALMAASSPGEIITMVSELEQGL